MDFSEALAALKAGERITRSAWNPHAFVTLMPGYPDGIAINATTAKATRLPARSMVHYAPYILIVVEREAAPYALANEDILAEDWMIYETSEEVMVEVFTDSYNIYLGMAQRALAYFVADWRALNHDTVGFDGRAWRVTFTGRQDNDDKVIGFQIEAIADFDADAQEKVMNQIARLGAEDPIKPGDANYPARPQRKVS